MHPGSRNTFIYAYRLFGVQNFEFQYSWGFSENGSFWGYEVFADIFGSSSRNMNILCLFYGLFLRSVYRLGFFFFFFFLGGGGGLLKCQGYA